jgi:hypothetical protein
MIFLDFKEPIKACDLDNLIIKDSFSYLTFLSSLLNFLLNLKKFSRSSLP